MLELLMLKMHRATVYSLRTNSMVFELKINFHSNVKTLKWKF